MWAPYEDPRLTTSPPRISVSPQKGTPACQRPVLKAPELRAGPAPAHRSTGSGASRAAGQAGARGNDGDGPEEHTQPTTHLVHVEDEVQLTDVLKALVQRLHKHLRWKEGKVSTETHRTMLPAHSPGPAGEKAAAPTRNSWCPRASP